jgi:hypothetical protein
MSSKISEHDYRIKELERQVKGLQRQVGTMNAISYARNKSNDYRLRDLEIKAAVLNGAPQKAVAKIFHLSPGRVSQIVKKVA